MKHVKISNLIQQNKQMEKKDKLHKTNENEQNRRLYY